MFYRNVERFGQSGTRKIKTPIGGNQQEWCDSLKNGRCET